MKPNTHNPVDPRNRPGTPWRLALMALAKPAMRMHKYRNLHKSMFYERMCELDCNDC